MDLSIYQIDAFTSERFKGNPAAVVPLEDWLPDETMLAIAEENNLSETAFFVPVSTKNNHYHIRWFTPTQEVNLCGHATLASAHVIFNILNPKRKKTIKSPDALVFDSLSGQLKVEKQKKDSLKMTFPITQPDVSTLPDILLEDFKANLLACYQDEDLIILLDCAKLIKSYQPDFNKLAKINARGISISAVSQNGEVQCRFFAPNSGINEDPVTGSTFTYLMPIWSELLNSDQITFRQVSKREGMVYCQLRTGNVMISGKSAFYMEGQIML